MKKRTILFLSINFIFLFFSIFSAWAISELNIKDADDLSNKFVKLDGNWDFYWDKFIRPIDFYAVVEPEGKQIVQVPAIWNNYENYNQNRIGAGAATYRLRITNLKPTTRYSLNVGDTIGTAADFFCNGKKIYSIGVPNENWQTTISDRNMQQMQMQSDYKGIIDLVIHVSNRDYRKAGIWGSLEIAESEFVQEWYTKKTNIEFLLTGALFAIILYHLFLFIFRRKEASSIHLALFALVLAIRLLITNFSLLTMFFPDMSFELTLKLEYTAIFFAPMMFILYLYEAANVSFRKGFFYLFTIMGSILGITTWVVPVYLANRLVPILELYAATYVLISLIYLYIYTSKSNVLFLFLMTLSILSMVFGAVYDLLPIIFPRTFDTPMLGVGVLIFFTIQSVNTAMQQAKMSHDVDIITNKLSLENANYNRFVPSFRQLLPISPLRGIKTVNIDENPENYSVTMTATLMCANIRNFTSIITTEGGATAFSLLNDWIATADSIITANGGHLIGLNGDQFFAVFPKNDNRIFECALTMKRTIHAICAQQQAVELPLLKIGIGIHFGKVVLGLTGSDATVIPVLISNSFGIVTHIESLTRHFDKTVLISGTAVRVLHAHNNYKLLKMNLEAAKEQINEDIYSLEART